MKVLAIHGSGLNFFWHIGFLESLDKKVLDSYQIYSCSGGSLASVLYLCNIKVENIINNFRNMENFSLNYLLNNMKELLNKIIPDNCIEKCKNLNIVYWKIFDGIKIKNNFESKEELIEYITITCRLPFTLKNFWEICKSFCMDPLRIDIEEEMKKILDDDIEYFKIKFQYDIRMSAYDCFVLQDIDEYQKKYQYGKDFGIYNVNISNNNFVYEINI